MAKSINWKLFLLLLILSQIGTISTSSYLFNAQKNLLENTLPFTNFFILLVIQNLILMTLAIFFGLIFSKKTGLSMPLFAALISSRPFGKSLTEILKISILFGICAAIIIGCLNYIFAQFGASVPYIPTNLPLVERIGAALYGGINREILMRLFFMNLFIWIFFKIRSHKNNLPLPQEIWTAIFLTAILSSIGRLPLTSLEFTITPLLFARGIIVNSIGGIFFGWLYWKKGLESAMIAHFTTDLLLLMTASLFV